MIIGRLRQTVYNILLEHLEASLVTIIKVGSFCRVRITRTASEQKMVIAKFNGKSPPPHRQIHLELDRITYQLQHPVFLMQKQIPVQALIIMAMLVFLNSVQMVSLPFLDLH